MIIQEQDTMRAIQNINRKLPDVTLRDLFAMSVIQTIDNNHLFDDEIELEMRAKYCYKVADAMLEARRK